MVQAGEPGFVQVREERRRLRRGQFARSGRLRAAAIDQPLVRSLWQQGGDRGNQHTKEAGYQVDTLPTDRTREQIAKRLDIGEATVIRNGRRAEVYDAVVAEKGVSSEEAKTAKTAPQSVIDAALASKKGVPMSETIITEKTRNDKKVKKANKAAKPTMKDQSFYEAPEDSFTKMLNSVKNAGPLPIDEFWQRIGGVTNQRWFKLTIGHIHYMHLQQDADTIELFVDESEKDLCTAIERQLHRMREWSKTQNRFKFDVDMYKKTIQDLYDLINKASTHK
jgi:hypothetical protein